MHGPALACHHAGDPQRARAAHARAVQQRRLACPPEESNLSLSNNPSYNPPYNQYDNKTEESRVACSRSLKQRRLARAGAAHDGRDVPLRDREGRLERFRPAAQLLCTALSRTGLL